MSNIDLILPSYYDLKTRQKRDIFNFFLENLLNARIALHVETGTSEYDEAINMYIASLLGSVATESRLILNKPYLSSYDFIIRSYIETHPGTRCEYQVYKDNADFGLLCNSFFSGYEHEGSYFQRVLSDRDENPRIAFYYKLAASALVHLRGVNNALVHVLYEIGKHIREIAAIIRKVAGGYFDIIGRLSEGSLFHLQKELDQAMQKSEYMKKLDEFLKLLGEYKVKALPELKDKIVDIVSDLKTLNPGFSFDACGI